MSTKVHADLCACGCGQPLNPRLVAARELRASGKTFAEIGRALNCSGSHIKHLLNNPPRYVKGHQAKVNWGFAFCTSCGKRFYKAGPRQTVCIARTCDAARWEIHSAKWAEYDRQVAERRERRETLVRERRWLRRVVAGQEQFGSDSWRAQKLAETEHEIAALGDELRVLYEEQQRDDQTSRWAGSRFVYSLDAPWHGEEDALYEYLEREDAIATAFHGYMMGHSVGSAWTDVVHALVDRRREIDEWATETAA